MRPLKLLPGKALRMKAKREYDLGHQDASEAQKKDLVRCECGCMKEEGDMVGLP